MEATAEKDLPHTPTCLFICTEEKKGQKEKKTPKQV